MKTVRAPRSAAADLRGGDDDDGVAGLGRLDSNPDATCAWTGSLRSDSSSPRVRLRRARKLRAATLGM